MFVRTTKFILGLTLIVYTTFAHASLSMKQAEEKAISDDPMLARLHEQAVAYQQQSIADAQLPDPKLKFGFMNYPTDTFDRDQEPMTQVQFGMQQVFPPGDTLEYKSKHASSMGDAQHSGIFEQKLKVRRSVRKAWLETWYWIEAGKMVQKSQELFRQLVAITQSRYSVGRQNQQNVIRAELELEMLSDKQSNIVAMEEKSRAELARWVGAEMASLSLPDQLAELDQVPEYEQIKQSLSGHPTMHVENAKVEASQQVVAVARESYKPKWMLDVTYGSRAGENMDGSDRADFASAMVMVDLPLFTDKRQDKRLAASQHRSNAAKLDRDIRYRELLKILDKAHADWQRTKERVQRYTKSLIPQVKANAEASLNAYQSDRGDFEMLMRARVMELNTQLQAMRLAADHAKAQAELLYLVGVE